MWAVDVLQLYSWCWCCWSKTQTCLLIVRYCPHMQHCPHVARPPRRGEEGAIRTRARVITIHYITAVNLSLNAVAGTPTVVTQNSRIDRGDCSSIQFLVLSHFPDEVIEFTHMLPLHVQWRLCTTTQPLSSHISMLWLAIYNTPRNSELNLELARWNSHININDPLLIKHPPLLIQFTLINEISPFIMTPH